MSTCRPYIWLLILALALGAGLGGAVAAEVVVIAHRDAPEDSVERSRLLDFYTGDIRQWEDGTRVIVFDLKDKGETRERFFEYIGKSSSRMRTIWLKRMLSGEGDPPEALADEEEMVRRIAATPGAIGFTKREYVTDSVKILVSIEAGSE